MPLFGKPDPHRQAERDRDEASRHALEQGELPIRAQERLANMAGGDRQPLFTSDLSPAEAALVRDAGYQPLGLVVGSCFYHVGLLYASYSDGELTGLSQAYTEAQDLAIRRLEQEVLALGAHGVIGVRFDMKRHEWAEHMVEVTVIGTAVRARVQTQPRPFLSDLSGQEFAALAQAGYEPRGLVYGNCVWVVFTTFSDEYTTMSRFNQEIPHMSRGTYESRRLAMGRLTSMASRSHAEGVVGVRFDRRVGPLRITGNDRIHHSIYLTVLGTAIAPTAGGVRAARTILPIMDLRPRKGTTAEQPASATFE